MARTKKKTAEDIEAGYSQALAHLRDLSAAGSPLNVKAVAKSFKVSYDTPWSREGPRGLDRPSERHRTSAQQAHGHQESPEDPRSKPAPHSQMARWVLETASWRPSAIRHHFALLKQIIEEHKIPWHNIYNMDEKGIQRGGRKTKQLRYLIPRSRRPKYKLRSPNLELVTVIECVSADGESLKPGFVFSGKEFHKEWFDVDPEICIAMSPNGWTDDFLCTEWFQKSFIPQAMARNITGDPLLLIYDGHGSHTTDIMIRIAINKLIHLFCLIPHTTHKTQPLDVGIFGPLQRAWQERCDDLMDDQEVEMEKIDIVKEYMDVRQKSITPRLVLAAWKKCGIRPLNPDIFREDEFAPSANTSTSMHFPPSFPFTRPSHPPSALAESVPPAGTSTDRPRTPPPPQSGPPTTSQPAMPTASTSQPEGDIDIDDLDSIFDSPEDTWDIDTEVGSDIVSQDEGWDYETDEELVNQAVETRLMPPSIVALMAAVQLDPSIPLSTSPVPLPSQHPIPHPDPPRAGQHPSQDMDSEASAHVQTQDAPSRTAGALPPMPPLTRYCASSASPDVARGLDTSLPPTVRIAALTRATRTLQEENTELREQRDSFSFHCQMAGLQMDALQSKYNAKESRKGKGKTRTLVTTSRCFTSGAGKAEWEAQSAQREAAAKEKQDTLARRTAQMSAREEQRRNQDEAKTFTGALRYKSKDDLLDIVAVLRITVPVDKTRCEDLRTAILEHFEKEPAKKQDPRYAGLFQTRGQKRTIAANDENVEPPSSRARRESAPPPLPGPSSMPPPPNLCPPCLPSSSRTHSVRRLPPPSPGLAHQGPSLGSANIVNFPAPSAAVSPTVGSVFGGLGSPPFGTLSNPSHPSSVPFPHSDFSFAHPFPPIHPSFDDNHTPSTP